MTAQMHLTNPALTPRGRLPTLQWAPAGQYCNSSSGNPVRKRRDAAMSLPIPCHLLKIENVDDITHVTFVPRTLDDSNVHTIGEQLYSLIDGQGRRKLQLDFSKVEVVTSAGLGKLVALHKKMLTVGGHLSLHKLRERTYEAFEVTRLDTLLDVRRSQREAGAA